MIVINYQTVGSCSYLSVDNFENLEIDNIDNYYCYYSILCKTADQETTTY